MSHLSIKNVPEPLAEALRQRAAANHRSLQRELMVIIEAAVQQNPSGNRVLQVAQRVASYGVETPSESASLVKQQRQTRTGELKNKLKKTAS